MTARRPVVVIVGAGVAGLEAALALRAFAGDAVDIQIVSPNTRFGNASMAVVHSAGEPLNHGVRIGDFARDVAADWRHDRLEHVVPRRRVVVTCRGTQLPYDKLVLALGARPERAWRSREVLTYHGRSDGPEFRLLLRQARAGRVGSIAFVKPPGPTWPMPLYDLALITAARRKSFDRPIRVQLVTPETEPLEVFGPAASEVVRNVLDGAGVELMLGSVGVPSRPGRLYVRPSGRRLAVDRIVTLPRLVGPSPCGVPQRPDGFIETDETGHVLGLHDVFAVGDVAAFPVKQGGLAAQHADAAAREITTELGIDSPTRQPSSVLRGLLMTGGRPLYLWARVSPEGIHSAASEEPLWWPPNRLGGRYLAPYLSRQRGLAADVMPQPGGSSPGGVLTDMAARRT